MIAPGFSQPLVRRGLLSHFLPPPRRAPDRRRQSVYFADRPGRGRTSDDFSRPWRSEPSSRTIVAATSGTGSASACGHGPGDRSWRDVARRVGRACPPSWADDTDVDRVLSDGRAFHADRVVLFVAPGAGSAAFVAGRRVGGAVLRNRARRILRAAWRELAPRVVEGNDVVLVARATIAGARSNELVSEVEELLTRAQVIR